MEKRIILLISLLCAASPVWAQPDTTEVEIQTVPVSGPVYMLVGAGGNIGVSAGPDGTLLIDDQFASLSDKIQEALEAIDTSPLRFVLNTHWHGDHTGGNKFFQKQAPVISHNNVRRRMSSGGTLELVGVELEASAQEALPLLTYEDGVSLHMNGEAIEVRHVSNAHTDGDSIVIFPKSNVVHLGDLMFSGSFPFVDRNSGGSVQGLISHIERLLDELPADSKIIPGHGPLSDMEDLKRYHEMLLKTTRLIRQRIDSGQAEDEAVSGGLPEQWKDWGSGFINEENWIRTVYRSYK